jgi:hypothetical protein
MAAVVVAICAITPDVSASNAVTDFRTVLLSGQQAPQLPAGVKFAVSQSSMSKNFPAINQTGQIAFNAVLTGNGVTSANNAAIYLDQGGDLRMLGRTGNQAPGLASGVTFSIFPDNFVNLTDQGVVVFRATLSGTGVTEANDASTWIATPTQLTMIGREGQQINGLAVSPQYLGGQQLARVDATGKIYFASALLNSPASFFGSPHAIFRYEPSGLVPLVTRFTSPPGANNVELIDDFVVSRTGTVAIDALLNDPNEIADAGIWRLQSGVLRQVARENQTTPDFPFFVAMRNASIGSPFRSAAINSAGQVLIHSMLTGNFGTPGIREGLWIGTPNGTQTIQTFIGADGVALSGEPQYRLAGLGAELVLNESSFNEVVMSNAGDIVFPARIVNDSTGYDGRSLLAYRNGLLDIVLKEGDQVPGLPLGTTFSSDTGAEERVAMNIDGDIVFMAGYRNPPGSQSTFGRGIWRANHENDLQLLLKFGDQIEVAPGDFREIELASFIVGSLDLNGKANSFNNFGQLALRVTFTDDTQAILVTVPEHITLIPILLLAACNLNRVTRRRSGAECASSFSRHMGIRHRS